MFELKCLIDDKKLASALRVLDGMIYEPRIVPVRGAKPGKNGRAKEANGHGGTPLAVYELLRSQKVEQPSSAEFRAACGRAGMSPQSYSYAVNWMLKSKLLSRRGNGRGRFKYRLLEKPKNGGAQ